MKKLVGFLGNPQSDYSIIHVAGTNGKGSVCSMLDSIYRANGYKVGLFSSPHLIELGERIRIDGENITISEIEFWVEKLIPIARQMKNSNIDDQPTFFEFMTAIAFLHFQRYEVDVAVIETGLGGRLDSTNVVTPKVCIITTISKDHCSILGDTLEKIAAEKAGIIKQGVPILSGFLPDCATEVVENIAHRKNAPFYKVENEFQDNLPETNLEGNYQKQNAALALKASELLKNEFPVKHDLSLKGLKNVKMLGRWQIISGTPKIILDACHNSAGADCLRENLEKLDEKPEVWVGVLGDDRAVEIMKVVSEKAQSIKLFEVQQPRFCNFKYLRSLIPRSFKGAIINYDLNQAMDELSISKLNKTILVTGSIYLIGDILSILKNENLEDKINWSDRF